MLELPYDIASGAATRTLIGHFHALLIEQMRSALRGITWMGVGFWGQSA
jgi:hypothetical protein